jgi:hypothetical protein
VTPHFSACEAALAEPLGVSQPAIARLESGSVVSRRSTAEWSPLGRCWPFATSWLGLWVAKQRDRAASRREGTDLAARNAQVDEPVLWMQVTERDRNAEDEAVVDVLARAHAAFATFKTVTKHRLEGAKMMAAKDYKGTFPLTSARRPAQCSFRFSCVSTRVIESECAMIASPLVGGSRRRWAPAETGMNSWPLGPVVLAAAAPLVIHAGCNQSPRPRPDDGSIAGLTPADFPQVADELFSQMDGGICLAQDEVKGRNTWILWTAGNQAFWDRMARESSGVVDLLKTLDSRLRAHRFARMGLMNEPGFRSADKPDAYGLWLDERVEPAPPGVETSSAAARRRRTGIATR